MRELVGEILGITDAQDLSRRVVPETPADRQPRAPIRGFGSPGVAANAARMPVPESVALKRPEDFKLIGNPGKRLDAPTKVNGTAVYGIDWRPPGVKIATLAQSPVFGGRVKSVDDTAAKAVKGVRQIVRLEDAVAVVADHMGAAKKGLAAAARQRDEAAGASPAGVLQSTLMLGSRCGGSWIAADHGEEIGLHRTHAERIGGPGRGLHAARGDTRRLNHRCMVIATDGRPSRGKTFR
jgi:hypothetical protein